MVVHLLLAPQVPVYHGPYRRGSVWGPASARRASLERARVRAGRRRGDPPGKRIASQGMPDLRSRLSSMDA